jgi:hypothetical protein
VLNPARWHRVHDPATVDSSDRQPDASDPSNVFHDRIHLVLTRSEVLDVASALRQANKPELAERLELILRLSSP